MTPNPGHCPPEAIGKRVRGVLRKGWKFGFVPVSSDSKAGWPADGKGAADWTLSGSEYDIISWELAS